MGGLLQCGQEGLIELIDLLIPLPIGLDLELKVASQFLLVADDAVNGARAIEIFVRGDPDVGGDEAGDAVKILEVDPRRCAQIDRIRQPVLDGQPWRNVL